MFSRFRATELYTLYLKNIYKTDPAIRHRPRDDQAKVLQEVIKSINSRKVLIKGPPSNFFFQLVLIS